MNIAAEKHTLDSKYYERYYQRSCEICVPIKLNVPVYVSPVVIETEPQCLDKNGY